MIDAARRWPLWVLGGITIVLLVWAVVARVRGPRRMRARMEQDAADPFRRWAQAVFCLVSGNCDYAYLPVGEAVRLLARWWEVHGPVELSRVLADLESEPDDAWPLVRFVVVCRLGVGARWLPEQEAWARTKAVCRRLQAKYDSWPALAHAYTVARRRAMGLAEDGSEDDDDMRAILEHVAHLHDTIWAEVPFRGSWRGAA